MDAALWVIVEGRDYDPYFADRLCRSSARIASAGYEITLIEQIEDDRGVASGGKLSLLAFFRYCRSAGHLLQTNSRGNRSLAFLIDRDADQIAGGTVRSKHAIYTVYADTEAHLLHETDEVEAIANACSLDIRLAGQVVAALGDWRRNLADSWRAWITVCYAARALSSSCWVGFSHDHSLIHVGDNFVNLDVAKEAAAWAAVQSTSRVLPADQASKLARVQARVDNYYSAGSQSMLLCGKWLPKQLSWRVDQVLHSLGAPAYHRSGMAESLARCYAAHMNPRGPGNATLVSALEALV